MIWTSSTGDILFIEEFRYSKNEKYSNFEIEDSGNQSRMIITNASLEDEGHYSCSDTISKATIQVNIEVAPRLSITYDGSSNPGPTFPNTISHLSISCLAEGARPSVSIRCKVGGSEWLRPKNKEILTRGSVFDTTVTLHFQFINDPNGTVVTCETSGQSSIKPITETQVLCSIKLRKQRNQDTTSNNEICQSDKRTLDPYQANYYTREDVKKKRHPKMVAEKDITIILNLKMGKIYKRWVGSVDLPWRSNTCVVITTMTDTARRTKDIQWEAFLRKCLELPKSNNLTTIEAISIQSDNMYLISEHLDCTTLHSMLTKNNYCSISLTVSDVIKHVTGVLEGVDVINKFGFLHPGLTTKKVLLTKEGQVKFYDFCLADDAPKIAELKKSEVTPVTVNQFPPETLSLNEYNVSSDVWSVAVVIWEIMAAGKPPFPDDKECYLDQMSDEPSFTWPEKYLQIKNTMLFDCWNRNPSHRPMIGSLKGSFLKEFQEVLTDSLYEAAVPSTYMPMRTPNAHKGIAEQILADISYEVSVSSTYMPMRTSKAYQETSEHVY
ncbi:putative ephrin type-A receptor 10 [Apostichopus japonicus]|uniref:Putative ephrin type-A receptor 10 n=1 Tax=Stichopus japonicus TaxID=307972 RepID=A0A2G8KLV6_STIJA|nr:putative ephrin type-A receptor 10 [Apostichopus japonicus]